jgi:hypothetical protein
MDKKEKQKKGWKKENRKTRGDIVNGNENTLKEEGRKKKKPEPRVMIVKGKMRDDDAKTVVFVGGNTENVGEYLGVKQKKY